MDLIGDLELTASLGDAVFTNIVSVYSMLESKSIDRAIKINHLVSTGDSDSITAVIRLLGFITETVVESRNYDESIAELNDTVKKLSSNNEQAALGWKKITSKLDELESYFISKKIDSIKDRYSRINNFKITTDVRPVFDMKRDKVDSVLYPYILKIQTTDDKTFVCEFYDETIDEIIQELEKAKIKFNIIKSHYDN